MGRAVFLPCSLAWGQSMVGVTLLISFWKNLFQDCCSQCPWPHGRPLFTHASIEDSWTLTGKSGSVSCGVTAPFFRVPGAHKVLCVLSKNLSPQSCVSSVIKSHWPSKSNSLGFSVRLPDPRLGTLLLALELSQQCKNFFGIIVFQFVGCLLGGFMLGLNCHASQVCFSHSTCPHSRPLLTYTLQETLKHSKAGLAQFLWGLLVNTGCFQPSKCLWWMWGLFLSAVLLLLPSCWGFSFALESGVSFFGGIQHSPVDGYSTVSCNFGVLTGEDEHTSIFTWTSP